MLSLSLLVTFGLGACEAGGLDSELDGLDIAPGVAAYADPSTHSPGLCGHMINDPRGTGAEANCVECPIGGGALIGILTLRDVRGGEDRREREECCC